MSTTALRNRWVQAALALAAAVAVVLSSPGIAEAATFTGTNGPDRIHGTRERDRVRARGGNDFIDVRGGRSDYVDCGRGFDAVLADRSDRVNEDNCERVRYQRPRRGGDHGWWDRGDRRDWDRRGDGWSGDRDHRGGGWDHREFEGPRGG